MDVPSEAATLDLWEAGEGLGKVERSLVLASAIGPPVGADELALQPLGRLDARLLGLHEVLDGQTLVAIAPCPACREPAEFAVDVAALRSRDKESVMPNPVEVDGHILDWRSPNSRDFAVAAGAADAAGAEGVLLTRCVKSARGPDGPVDVTTLPGRVREALAQAMSDADPLAEVHVIVTCPACGAEFVADFDIGGFVWAEVRSLAHRLLREVDALARAYGWTEREVLALGTRRRAVYLSLIGETGA